VNKGYLVNLEFQVKEVTEEHKVIKDHGEHGIQGLTGFQGFPGPKGPEGDAGTVGISGPKGPIGQRVSMKSFCLPRYCDSLLTTGIRVKNSKINILQINNFKK
ncbi:hypothetical protein E2I00_019283, partial [Balaenoptera physalus]